MRVTDMHAHFIPVEFLEMVDAGKGPPGLKVEWRGAEEPPMIVHEHGLRYPALDIFTRVDARLEQLDRDGIDAAVLSIVPTLFMYEVAEEVAVEVSATINDAASARVAEAPDRLAAMATVALNAPEEAAEEVRRCRQELGLRGVEIGPSAGDVQLDDERLDPFYAAAAELGMPLMLHPYRMMTGGGDPGLAGYHLANVIGNPTETFIGIARMIMGGVFDRHPELEVVLVHGGGAFPFQLGRLDHAYEVREEARGGAAKRPSRYLDRIHFDTVVFSDAARRYLVDLAGDDHVMFGTDLPFDMGDISGRDLAAVFPEDSAQRILGANARRLYGI